MAPSPLFDSATAVDKDAVTIRLLVRVDELCARLATVEAENSVLRTRVAELEAKLGLPPKTPNNSSTPPSQGRKASGEEKKKSEGERRKAHAGAHRPLHPDPTSRRDVTAKACQDCGADVSQRPQAACEAYDHVEIPGIKPDVTRVTLFGGTCPCCAKKFKAPAPQDMPKGSPFGENLRAFVIYLRFTQGVAFARLSTLLSDLLGIAISEGALINMLDASREAFAAQTNAIRQQLLSGTALQSDETGLRVGKKNWWLWVFHHEDSAVFVAKPSRAKAVVEDFLGDFRPDCWVSDRYGGQMGFAKKDHQVCLAHLIRDVNMRSTLVTMSSRQICAICWAAPGRIGRRRDRLADATLKTYAARLDARLDELMARQPAHAAGIKLQRMIKRTRRYLFVFVTNRDLPATNNGSERALRPCAVFRKITNGFRTQWGAELYADIRSIVETGRRRAISALDAIRLTLAGKPLPIAA